MMSNNTNNSLTLSEELGAAELELNELLAEKERLPGLVKDSSESADAVSLVAHSKRIDEIDVFIKAARAKLCRKRLSAQQMETPKLDAEAYRLAEIAARAQERFDAARDERDATRNAYALANSRAHESRLRSGELTRELAQLTAQCMNAPQAPVVRSRWHAPKAA